MGTAWGRGLALWTSICQPGWGATLGLTGSGSECEHQNVCSKVRALNNGDVDTDVEDLCPLGLGTHVHRFCPLPWSLGTQRNPLTDPQAKGSRAAIVLGARVGRGDSACF